MDVEDATSPSLLSPCLQEASASFAQWERMMKELRSGVAAADNPFSQVMGLVTQMYKQTAVAKVTGNPLALCFASAYLFYKPC